MKRGYDQRSDGPRVQESRPQGDCSAQSIRPSLELEVDYIRPQASHVGFQLRPRTSAPPMHNPVDRCIGPYGPHCVFVSSTCDFSERSSGKDVDFFASGTQGSGEPVSVVADAADQRWKLTRDKQHPHEVSIPLFSTSHSSILMSSCRRKRLTARLRRVRTYLPLSSAI